MDEARDQPLPGSFPKKDPGYEVDVERSFETRRLSCKDRSQGCISNSSNLEASSKVSAISLEGNPARICLPPFRVSHSPQGIHKINETSSGCFKTAGHSSSDILGRHTNHGGIAGLSITPCSINLEPLGGPRFYSQLQKSQLVPCQKNIIFRFSNRFYQSNTAAARGETSQNSKEMPKDFRDDRDFSSRIIKIPGPPNLLHSGHFSSTSPLQASSKAEEYYNDLRAFVRGSSDTRYSSQRGSSVVERSPSRVEWQSAIPTTSRPNNRDRCISKGLGGLLRGGQYWGPMVLGGEMTIYQLSRAACRVVCNQNVHKDQSMCTCETHDGQCSSSCIYKQDGGTHSHALANLAIALCEWCHENQLIVSAQHLPGILNVRAERESRVLTDSSDWKLNPNLFPAIVRTWGPLEVDLFASRLTYQLPQFVSWKPDPLAIQTDAFAMNWQTTL